MTDDNYSDEDRALAAMPRESTAQPPTATPEEVEAGLAKFDESEKNPPVRPRIPWRN